MALPTAAESAMRNSTLLDLTIASMHPPQVVSVLPVSRRFFAAGVHVVWAELPTLDPLIALLFQPPHVLPETSEQTPYRKVSGPRGPRRASF